MAKGKKRRFGLKVMIAIIFFTGLSIVYLAVDTIYSSNVNTKAVRGDYLYIPSGASYGDVVEILTANKVLINIESFKWMAEVMNYPKHVYPGKYKLKENMNNRELITMLRTGDAETIKVQFEKLRTKEQLVGYLTNNLEADSTELITMLNDRAFLRKYGFNQYTIMSMFIPNTYYFNWNTPAREVFDRMAKEYKSYWNQERKSKAQRMGLSQSEVSTLASIVEEETYRKDERNMVAGVYVNRLKKGMKLQADPTVKYATGDFTLKRILNKHLKTPSPYNTYLHKGLPPGPICVPTISSLESVLNAASHKYLYFCAKEDFSGYHNFAKTYAKHLQNARKYQKTLSARKRK